MMTDGRFAEVAVEGLNPKNAKCAKCGESFRHWWHTVTAQRQSPELGHEFERRLKSNKELRAAEDRRTVQFVHGAKAKVVTKEQVLEARLRRVHKDAPEILRAFLQAVEGRDLNDANSIAALALTETEILRRLCVKKIKKDGVSVQESLTDRDGKVYCVKVKPHPLLDHVHRFNEDVGAKAEAMQITNQSRGQGDRDEAIVAMLKRDEMLRSADKTRFPLLPPAIDITPTDK